MKLSLHSLVLLAAIILFPGCSREQEPVTMKVYQSGNEYLILDRGDTESDGQLAYFVRYLSDQPGNAEVRRAESADLYAIIAQHIDTNKHHRVVIEAVGKKSRLLGLLPPREVRESKPVAAVLSHKPGPPDPAPEGP